MYMSFAGLCARLTGGARPRFFESYLIVDELCSRISGLPSVAAHSMIIEKFAPVGQQLRARGCRFAAVGQTASGKEWGRSDAMTVGCTPTRPFARAACV